VLALATISVAAGLGAPRARAADGGAEDAAAAVADGGTPLADGGRDAAADGAAGAAGDAGAPPDAGAPRPAPAAVGAPVVALRGTVLARGGHRRITGATVFVDGVVAGESDATGAFAVTAPAGRHHLQVEASGFHASDDVIDVDPRGWTGVVRLAAGGRVYETVIVARPPTAAVRVSGEEARTAAGTGGDPFRIIESLPGVSQIVWPFAAYAIRGANPGNTGFFLDGMRVPALYHFALGPSIIHPYLVDKVTFYPGGYPARYGGYVSGVVVADTAPPPTDLSRLAVDVRLYDAGALAATPWDGGRGTVAVAARYSYTGLIVSRLFPEVNFGYSDYQLRVDHTLFGGRVTLLSFGSFDTLDIKEGGIGDASLNFHRLDLRWERAIAGGRLLARTAFATDGASSQLYSSPISVRAYTVAPKVAFSRPFSDTTSVEVGAEAQAQHFHTDSVQSAMGPPLGDLAHTRSALTTGVYVGATLGWSRLALEPGLRYAYYAEQGTTRGYLEPRLAVRVQLRPGTSLEGTFGRFSQMPSLPLAVAGFDGFGLADYGLQTSTQAAVGVDTRLPRGFVLRATTFYQWLYVSDLESTFNMNITDKEFLEMRPGRGYGAELQLRLPTDGRVTGWLAYTLSWSERDFEGVYGPSDWDQRHIVNLLGEVKLTRDWSAGARFHYNTGRPYPVQTTDPGGPTYIRLPDFWQVDLRADRHIVLDRATLDFYIELGNATFTREVIAYKQSADKFQNEAVGFRIILPSIGLHAEW
jgi:hypothetical protein